jgi:Tol biopolymer transport system component
MVNDWSPDGKYLLYWEGAIGSQKLWVTPADGSGKPVPATADSALSYSGAFSPDGRWLAYTAYEGGRSDIFVAPFPPTGAKWQVSQAGGDFPRWRRDGKELYYFPLGDNQFYSVEVDGAGNSIQIGRTTPLFRSNLNGIGWLYDTLDGQRFFIAAASEQSDRPLTLVVNWTEDLKKK